MTPEEPTHHYEHIAVLHATVEEVFAFADDHTSLSGHMNTPSWRTGWGRMRIKLDEGWGKSVGSHIRLTGCIAGITLAVDEVVTERDPPHRKTWETVGSPRLLVIGHYRMGFDIVPRENDVRLRVFIDYALPDAGWSRWLGCLFGRHYARWCVHQMAEDATALFVT